MSMPSIDLVGYWPVASANGDIFMALLVALLFTLCVQWINYGQHTPDKVAIVVVVIDWFGFKTLLGPVDQLPSVHCRLGSDVSTLLHITPRSYHPQSVREPGHGTMRKLRWEWGVGTNLQTNLSATAVAFSDNITKSKLFVNAEC